MQSFVSKSNRKNFKKLVLAVGGGTIIDAAKTYAKIHNMFCIAIPTTGAGATETTHAVKWGKKKVNIPTDKPITVMPPFKVKLSKKVRRNTALDILGHIVDYLNVCTDNELVEVGIYAGKLIEKRPTNLTHPKSYPLTLKGVPHGEAVGMVLGECIDEVFPLKRKRGYL